MKNNNTFFVYDYELRKKKGIYFSRIEVKIKKENSIFEIVNREEDIVVSKLETQVIQDKKNLILLG